MSVKWEVSECSGQIHNDVTRVEREGGHRKGQRSWKENGKGEARRKLERKEGTIGKGR